MLGQQGPLHASSSGRAGSFAARVRLNHLRCWPWRQHRRRLCLFRGAPALGGGAARGGGALRLLRWGGCAPRRLGQRLRRVPRFRGGPLLGPGCPARHPGLLRAHDRYAGRDPDHGHARRHGHGQLYEGARPVHRRELRDRRDGAPRAAHRSHRRDDIQSAHARHGASRPADQRTAVQRILYTRKIARDTALR